MTGAEPWRYYSPVDIRCGVGSLQSLPDLVVGGRVLLVTSSGARARGVLAEVRRLLGAFEVVERDGVTANPSIRELEHLTAGLSDVEPTSVVAVGGGSVMDTGKALSAALSSRPGSRAGVRELLASGGAMLTEPLPLVAVPTTAGTGSEVTPFATIWDDENHRKLSLSAPFLLPQAAVIDPLLTRTLPRSVTVASGLDAVSQALEALWNRNANPVTDSLALGAARTGIEALPGVLTSPGDLALRQRMMEAALQAGLAIARTHTALAHSMSYPLTAHHGLPHGIACSFTLPAILAFNTVEHPERMSWVARSLGYSSVGSFRERIEGLLAVCEVEEALRERGVDIVALHRLTGEMVSRERAGNNLRAADRAALEAILGDVASYLPGLVR